MVESVSYMYSYNRKPVLLEQEILFITSLHTLSVMFAFTGIYRFKDQYLGIGTRTEKWQQNGMYLHQLINL